MEIAVNGYITEVMPHPEFTYYATSREGRVFCRPAQKSRVGLPKHGPRPREAYWVEVSQFTVQPRHTPPYRKCRVTQDGATKIVSVHRFMLECWDSIQPRRVVVRHLDGDPLNNTLSNLKYGTVQENVSDAFKHTGNYAEGGKNGRAELSESDVRSIRARYDSGESCAVIHGDYPFVSKNSILNAAKRLTWSHLD